MSVCVCVLLSVSNSNVAEDVSRQMYSDWQDRHSDRCTLKYIFSAVCFLFVYFTCRLFIVLVHARIYFMCAENNVVPSLFHSRHVTQGSDSLQYLVRLKFISCWWCDFILSLRRYCWDVSVIFCCLVFEIVATKFAVCVAIDVHLIEALSGDRSEDLRMFFRVLCLCNTVFPEMYIAVLLCWFALFLHFQLLMVSLSFILCV